MLKLKSTLLIAFLGLSAVAAQVNDGVVLVRRRLKQGKDDKKTKKKSKGDKKKVSPSPPPSPAPTSRPTAAPIKANKKTKKTKKKTSKKTNKKGGSGPEPTEVPTEAPIDPSEAPIDPTEAPIVPTASPTGAFFDLTEAPTASPTEGLIDLTEAPTEAPTDPPVQVVILTLAVCAPVCDDVNPTTPDFMSAIVEWATPRGVDPSTVTLEISSISECQSCGGSRRRLLGNARAEGEVEIEFTMSSTESGLTDGAMEESIAQRIEDLPELAELLQPGATMDPDSITVTTPPPTESPTESPSEAPTDIGTPSPAGRNLQESLFNAGTKDVTVARESHEFDDFFRILYQLNVEARMDRGYEVLSEFMYDEELTSTKHHHESNRAIVAYSAPTSMDLSDPKQSMYHSNFLYFLDNAINCSKHSTLIIATEVVAEVYRPRIEELNEELCADSPYSVEMTLRVNKCYDMESMATFFRKTDASLYDYFLYINCGMVGPKMEGDEHWTEVFTSRLSDKVKLTGVSINMSFFPHLQSMSLATDRVGLEIIKNSGAVYDCGVMNDVEMNEEERWRIIDRYELGMSRAILEAGYTINSLTGSLGKAITLDMNDIDRIKEESKSNKLNTRHSKEAEGSYWTDAVQNFVLPLGEDIWNPSTIRTMGDGGLPSWSDFIFYKASRGIILPEIFAEVEYDDPTIEVIEDYSGFSLDQLEDPNRDICEEAKINFREASKLGVIVTGYEHTGTTMLAQLIKSAPGLFGGFECGVAVVDDESQFYEWLTWSPENDLWGLNNESRDIVVNARCIAERYRNLHTYSPIFHYGDHEDNLIVDKTPRYLYTLVDVMEKTPGIPVVITNKEESQMWASYKKRGYADDFINSKIRHAKKQIEAAMKKFPGRIKIVDTTSWLENPNEIMEDVYDFLGLEWNPEYLNMKALNSKRLPGSVVSKPFQDKNVMSLEMA